MAKGGCIDLARRKNTLDKSELERLLACFTQPARNIFFMYKKRGTFLLRHFFIEKKNSPTLPQIKEIYPTFTIIIP